MVLAITKASSELCAQQVLRRYLLLGVVQGWAGGGTQAEMLEPLTGKCAQPWTDSLEIGYSYRVSCFSCAPPGHGRFN